MADYIPSDDATLLSWAQNFSNSVGGQEATFGIVAGDSSDIEDALTLFGNHFSAHQVAQNGAKSATALKNESRNSLVAIMRRVVKKAQASGVLNDSKRATLQITIPDTTPTAVPAPTSRPMVAVDTSNRLLHKVKFTDENTPLSNAKPAGVLGCEIYVKIGGDAPIGLDECKFLGVATKTPYEVSFSAEDGGKVAHYLCRWATRSGLTGATSQLTSSTIVA